MLVRHRRNDFRQILNNHLDAFDTKHYFRLLLLNNKYKYINNGIHGYGAVFKIRSHRHPKR